MIRRTVRNEAGRDETGRDETGAESWTLISQVEHARLSGMLAEAWDPALFSMFPCRGELLAAIYHHDDGWAAWERSPGIDPQTGRPLNFTEMPLVESLAIWRDSISSAGRHGNLAAHVVSGHFCSLLRRFSSRWQNDPAKGAMAAEFLTSQQQHQADRLAAWRERSNVADAAAIADAALKLLQTFDSLSLWLCCSEQPEPETFMLSGGSTTTVRLAAPFEVEISPWPFGGDRAEFEVVGRNVPAIRYQSPAELAVAPSRQAKLKWAFLGSLGKKA